MKRLDLMVGVLLVAAILGATLANADPLDTRSFYDRNGGFAGSSSAHQNTTSYSDRDGRFSGSSIRNSDGTTSLYDRNGHFTGSVVNTSPSGGRDGRR
jgi:hypothetical protein